MAQILDLFPVFAIRDLDESLGFYQGKLGFSINWIWGEPRIRAGVGIDGIEIQLDCTGIGAPPGPSVVYCHVKDVRDYYEVLKRRDVSFYLELAERPWGMVDFRVRDPDGNQIGFGERTH